MNGYERYKIPRKKCNKLEGRRNGRLSVFNMYEMATMLDDDDDGGRRGKRM